MVFGYIAYLMKTKQGANHSISEEEYIYSAESFDTETLLVSNL